MSISIVILHQQERLESIRGRCKYIEDTLRETSLEPWERKEYIATLDHLEAEASEIEMALKMAAAYDEKGRGEFFSPSEL